MSVTRAAKRLPVRLPMSTMVLASSMALSTVVIMAPEPVFTSSTITSAPLASFLLRIELTMSGITSTVEVTSLNA